MDDLHSRLDSWISKQKYTRNLGSWYKGKSNKIVTIDELYNSIPKELIRKDAYDDVISKLELIGAEIESEDDNGEVDEEQELKMKEFDQAYKNLLMNGWSNADEIVYRGLRYTMNNNAIVLLAKTGNGNEYKIIGRDSDDLYEALSGLTVADGRNRIAYINDEIIRPILDICYGNWSLSAKDLNNKDLAGSVADVLYCKGPVYNDKRAIIGYKLNYSGGKPSVLRYIEKSLEAFISNPTKHITTISPISNNADEATFRYIPVKLKSGDWSAYQKWFNDTFDNVEDSQNIFMQRIGGMLDAKNRSKQMLYINGPGNDGKSTVVNAISKFMGAASRPIDISLFKDGGFPYPQFVGNRIAVVDDSKNPKLVATNWVHKVIGYSQLVINDKNEKIYTVQSITNMIQIENIAPIVNLHEDNQTSRIIYLKCKQKTLQEKIDAGIVHIDDAGNYQAIGDTKFEQLINDQVEAFLAACLDRYMDPKTSLCPKNAQFIVPSKILDNLIECGDSKDTMLQYIIENNYIAEENGFVPRHELNLLLKTKVQKDWNDISTPITIKAILEKTYGITKLSKKTNANGVRVNGYYGISIRYPNQNDKTSSFSYTKQLDTDLEQLSNYKGK